MRLARDHDTTTRDFYVFGYFINGRHPDADHRHDFAQAEDFASEKYLHLFAGQASIRLAPPGHNTRKRIWACLFVSNSLPFFFLARDLQGSNITSNTGREDSSQLGRVVSLTKVRILTKI